MTLKHNCRLRAAINPAHNVSLKNVRAAFLGENPYLLALGISADYPALNLRWHAQVNVALFTAPSNRADPIIAQQPLFDGGFVFSDNKINEFVFVSELSHFALLMVVMCRFIVELGANVCQRYYLNIFEQLDRRSTVSYSGGINRSSTESLCTAFKTRFSN